MYRQKQLACIGQTSPTLNVGIRAKRGLIVLATDAKK